MERTSGRFVDGKGLMSRKNGRIGPKCYQFATKINRAEYGLDRGGSAQFVGLIGSSHGFPISGASDKRLLAF